MVPFSRLRSGNVIFNYTRDKKLLTTEGNIIPDNKRPCQCFHVF